MKLKTLKDLNTHQEWVNRKELFEEAIKWIKCEEDEDVDVWIKHFFNITEEDLK